MGGCWSIWDVGVVRAKSLMIIKKIRAMDFPDFARHQIALKCNSMRGVYDQQTIHRRIQNRSGKASH